MTASSSIIAYIALGANLGEREANIRLALSRLNKIPGVSVTKVSRFMDNPAVGGPSSSPPFLNAAAEVHTQLDAETLLAKMLELERSLGRERLRKWEPRPIDLDLLLYGDHTIHLPGLIVPHPLMHERRFVLTPLAEIAPDAIHPVLRRSIAELLRELPAE